MVMFSSIRRQTIWTGGGGSGACVSALFVFSGCIGVNIEPADSDESSIDEGAEQDFSRPVEPIRTRGPLIGQPADQTQSKPFTFRDELADRRRREIVQRFDRDESDVAHSPLRSCPIMIR